jgi:hypothetical protein
MSDGPISNPPSFPPHNGIQSPHLLKTMGIELWYERNGLIKTQSAIIQARLTIILSSAIETTDEQTILEGMIRVLELHSNEWWTGWINPEWQSMTPTLFWDALKKMKPQALLCLGESLNTMLMHTDMTLPIVMCTYHPRELARKPELKKKSYHDLLRLKYDLHALPINNTKGAL